MSDTWCRSPFLRLLLFCVAGAWAGLHMAWSLRMWTILVVAAVLLFMITHFGAFFSFTRRHFTFLPAAMLMAAISAWSARFQQTGHSTEDVSHHIGTRTSWLVRIADDARKGSYNLRSEAEVIACYDDSTGQWQPVSGTLMLRIRDTTHVPQPDDVICVHGSAESPPGPRFPGAFDYAAYLRNKGICVQLTADSISPPASPVPPMITLRGSLLRWRQQLMDRFPVPSSFAHTRGIIEALLFGFTDDLDAATKQSYSSSGTVHILAVSGLHVGLIYVVLAPVLARLMPGKRRPFLKTLIPATLLWGYAAITGFSPSVLRSAVMFTLFIISENYSRQSAGFNTLCASAVVLIWWDPRLIHDTGFHLSYLAVGGILALQRPLVQLVYFPNPLFRRAWELCAVSIAAQASTMPYTLYFFHQFPNYFLLANVIMIPLSTFALYTGLAWYIAGWIPGAGSALAWLCAASVHLMNMASDTVGQLPGALTRDVSMHLSMAILLFVLIVCISRWLFWKKRSAAIWTAVVIAAMMIVQVTEIIAVRQKDEWCALAGRNTTWFIRTTGGVSYVAAIGDSLKEEQSDRPSEYLKHLGTRVVAVHSREELPWPEPCVWIDSTWNRYYFRDSDIGQLRGKLVLLSPTLSRKKRRFLQNKCAEYEIPCHDLANGYVIGNGRKKTS